MCEYCRTHKTFLGEITADNPKDIFSIGDNSFSATGTVLVDFFNIVITGSYREETNDLTAEANTDFWIGAEINYCPMCGRKLRSKMIPFAEFEKQVEEAANA